LTQYYNILILDQNIRFQNYFSFKNVPFDTV
jgi:hypothetical protein